MYILLEPGMRIEDGDEFYDDGWRTPELAPGTEYNKHHLVCRREITTIKELVEIFTKESK